MQEPPGEGTSRGRGQWDSNGMGKRVENGLPIGLDH